MKFNSVTILRIGLLSVFR